MNSLVYSKNTIEFVTVANEFCKFIENTPAQSLANLVETAHRLLPLLYLKGTLLPEVENSYEEFNEKFVTEANYNQIHDLLLEKFADHNTYFEVFDPLRQENDEPAQLSLAESLTDIYQDMKDFIMQFQQASEEIMLNAIWECRQNFGAYWGQRTVNVLRALHYLQYTIVDLDKETKSNSATKDFNYNNVDTKNWLISRMQENYTDEE